MFSRACLAVLPIVAVACATGAKGPKADLARVERSSLTAGIAVQRYRLANGLKVLVVEDHSSPTFAYQTWFGVGSRDEDPGKSGLAHLFEHMMFKETRNLKDGEFTAILENAGAEGENAFTSRDYTAYVQELPVGNLDLIAKLESDRMVNLVVDGKSFATEREVVQNERRMRTENSPEGTMDLELYQLAFKVHSYRWPVIGYAQDLDAMGSGDAEAFYRKWYGPSRATVVVVGDVVAEDVFDTIERRYGALVGGKPAAESAGLSSESSAGEFPAVPPTGPATEPGIDQPRRARLALNMQVEKIQMGYRNVPYVHPDTPAMMILETVLGSGRSSRLNRALVDTGVASSVWAGSVDAKDPSLFEIAVNLQKGKKAAHAESIALRELDRLAREPIGKEELERARNQLGFGFYQRLSSNSAKASFLGRAETLAGRFEAALDFHAKSQTASADEVRALAAQIFAPNARVVVTGVPK